MLVDLMLETNLDALIELSTSFLAARKLGLLENCLWNGFVAAEPGHPILARAIENVLRSILLGVSDSSSLQRLVLSKSRFPYETEIWKLRAVDDPYDYIFGHCGLGVALNQALQYESPVRDLELGLHRSALAGSDLLILLVRRERVVICCHYLTSCADEQRGHGGDAPN